MMQAIMTSPGVIEHKYVNEPSKLSLNEVLPRIRKIFYYLNKKVFLVF